jgi:perosamine synthetase
MKRYEFSLQYPKPLGEHELSDLIEVAKSGNFSRYTSELTIKVEKELAAYYQVAHAITCTSGTAALQGALVALDFPVGSEIIMTSVADIGIVIPVIYENLIPVFADVETETYNISAQTVEKCITDKTKAVIAVHLAGSPCHLDSLRALCNKYDLKLLEDFSQAHGALWDNKKMGGFGDISYGSFQQSKQITCGEGGVIVTNDQELARRAFIGVDKAWQRERPLNERIYEFLAPNVRFSALQAAVLRPQIKRLDDLVNKKRERARLLYEILAPYSQTIKTQAVCKKAMHAYYSFPLYVESKGKRDALVKLLDEKFGVQCAYGYANPSTLYQCVEALKHPKVLGKAHLYSNRSYPEGLCPMAEDLLSRSFLIPFNENFTLSETKEIGMRLIEAVKEVFSTVTL